ncbi:hypothetical protein ACQ4M3_35955 [Leptolyngbya sp. AN03gr2]|uniref:hypothetical protein n=1 Tax=unclassified Leptolyngbya TaxID=2650499 RepID=UPI003D320E00
MRTVYSSLLSFTPVWFLSALLHSMDKDINGISGLAKPTVLFSVTLIGLFLYLPVLIPLAQLRSQGIRGYWVGLLSVSWVIGAVIAAVGSSATTMQGRLVSFAGVSLVCTSVYGMATVPGVLALRHSRLRSSE